MFCRVAHRPATLRMIPGSLLAGPATLRIVLFCESAMKIAPSDVTAIPLRSLSESGARSSCATVAAPPSPRDPASPTPAIAVSAVAGAAEVVCGATALPSAKTRFGAAAVVRSGPACGSRAKARTATPVAMMIAFAGGDCPGLAANASVGSLRATPNTTRIAAANAQMPSSRRTSSPSSGIYRRFGFTCRRSGCVASRPSYQRLVISD